MKSIEEEIVEIFVSSRRQTKNKERNAKVALAYYGFSSEVLPTLEAVGKKYAIGTIAAVRQTLEEYFKNNGKVKQIHGIRAAANLVSAKPISFWSDIKLELCKNRFISDDYVAAHLLVLLKDLGMCDGFELYTPTGDKVTRRNAVEFEQYLFVRDDVKKEFSKDISKLRRLPTRFGMATLKACELTHFKGKDIGLLINGIPDSWQTIHEGQTWFLFEDRAKGLINQLEKAFCTGEICEISRLAESIENGLRNGAANPGFPPVVVIQQYLRSSNLTRIENEFVTFCGKEGNLGDIETACIKYFESIDRQSVDSPSLKAHLKSLGFGEGWIRRAVFNSALVHIDKTGGRGAHRFSLVCHQLDEVNATIHKDDRYQEFVNRLKDVAKLGTDAECEAKRRREQHLLAKWIFADNKNECCAICGKELEKAALRTAHKKKRSECHVAEQLDPYIVMPICLFGCDYLYENKFVTVRDGKVAPGPEKPLSKATNEAIDQVLGREIDARWTAGKAEYFH